MSTLIKIAQAVPTANPKNMFVVRALDKYKGKNKEELTFSKGDLILVYEENEGNYKGEIISVTSNGKTPKTHIVGWFPSYYALREEKDHRNLPAAAPVLELPVIKKTTPENTTQENEIKDPTQKDPKKLGSSWEKKSGGNSSGGSPSSGNSSLRNDQSFPKKITKTGHNKNHKVR